jgi:putative membrane protein
LRKILRIAVATATFVIAMPIVAQVPPATMTVAQVGASPLTGTSGTDYVKFAADSDNFEIQSGRIAAMKSRNKDVRNFGQQMISAHTGTSKSLMAALNNQDRKITPPSPKLSADNQAKIDLLRKAPKNSFDQIYIAQQLEAHKAAWALHTGYATDGTDASLKQVAMTAIPVVESHLSMLQGMAPHGM